MSFFRIIISQNKKFPEESILRYTATQKIEATDIGGNKIISHNYNKITKQGEIICNNEITSLGNFGRNSALTEIVIPKNCDVNGYTFLGARNLSDIKVSEGHQTLKNIDSGLVDIQTNELVVGTTTFGYYPIPDNIEKISRYALASRDLREPEPHLRTVLQIDDYAFYNSSITTISISNEVTLGTYVFSDCIDLRGVYWTVSKIPEGTFKNCRNLLNINSWEGISTIQGGAFSGCSNLTVKVLPNVTYIDFGVFSDCMGSLFLDNKIIENGSEYAMSSMRFLDGCRFSEVILGDSVENIGPYAFYDLNIKKVILGKNTKTIGGHAFASSGLKEIYMYESPVEKIYSNSFSNTYLEKIVLPNTIKEIPLNAFFYSSLQILDLRQCTTVPTIYTALPTSEPLEYKIIVPDSMYSDMILSEDLSDIKQYIYPASSYNSTELQIAYIENGNIKTINNTDWDDSLGTPFGIVVIPSNILPDKQMRILNLDHVTGYFKWGPDDINALPDHSGVYNIKSAYQRDYYLPSDNFSDYQPNIDTLSGYLYQSEYNITSPYLIDNTSFNPSYGLNYPAHKNALSDFNGYENTEILYNLGAEYQAANIAWNYNDGVTNLQWYLPSLGEQVFVMVRLKEINSILQKLNKAQIYNDSYYATSTEATTDSYYGDDSAYSIRFNTSEIFRLDKRTGAFIRPFTKI